MILLLIIVVTCKLSGLSVNVCHDLRKSQRDDVNIYERRLRLNNLLIYIYIYHLTHTQTLCDCADFDRENIKDFFMIIYLM